MNSFVIHYQRYTNLRLSQGATTEMIVKTAHKSSKSERDKGGYLARLVKKEDEVGWKKKAEERIN